MTSTGLSNGSTDTGAGIARVSTERGSGDGGSAATSGDHGDGVGTRGLDRGVTPIPSSIVQALCQIMVTVEAVKKSQKNQHGGYMFASTDDIYAAVTRKMGEVGLMMLALEDRCEVKKVEKAGKDGVPVVSQWAHMEFSFVLATTNATWSDPRAKRTLYIQVTGPQTFQAAQSYAEKSFLRSLLKLPTGDMDLDSMPQADNEDDQIALNARRSAPRKASAEGKRDGSVETFNQLRGRIANATNAEDLQSIYVEHCDRNGAWSGMPPRWADMLQDDYEVKRDGFTAIQAAE